MSRFLPESQYDKFADFYLEFVHREDPAQNPIVEAVVAMLGDVTRSEVCDLACGEGFLSRFLTAKGARVTGIDLSAKLIEHARHLSNGLLIDYAVDDAQRLASLPSSLFDIVVCNMALMDIPGLKETYGAVNRILRDEGTFVFSVVHPCFETPFNAENPAFITDENGNFVAKRVARYGEEGKWFSDGDGMYGTLGSFHRKLSTYLNTLVGASFTIVEIVEPMLPPGEYGSITDQWASMVPRFLIVKSTKVGCSSGWES
ncbi:MAG: methyltransferase domain-containing protein [Caldilineaceae bacterium SB0665_bin_21]|nr:methyltransferase domain-containing protein [Caldilineaceae bacterium SB0665_bin_21]MYC62751.1 methyltransferase domain-containing protein [Caldilineaceae bacterium SB0661_bin_34]